MIQQERFFSQHSQALPWLRTALDIRNSFAYTRIGIVEYECVSKSYLVREFSLGYLLQMVKKLGMHVVISCQLTAEDELGDVTISLPLPV
jgi:hypothetical protein